MLTSGVLHALGGGTAGAAWRHRNLKKIHISTSGVLYAFGGPTAGVASRRTNVNKIHILTSWILHALGGAHRECCIETP